MFIQRNFSKMLLGVLILFALSSQQTLGAIQTTAFSELYTPVAPISSNQSQLVYFRSGKPVEGGGAANLYVDQEFHTALLPGGFSAFCLAPGNHSLLTFLNDAPGYKGKQSQHPFALKGGETVFMRVNPDGNGVPQIVPRAAAERELLTNRRQTHVVSRASAIVACAYEPTLAQRTYTLKSDVLFAFGKSGYADLTTEGRGAIGQIVAQLRAENIEAKLIEVIGHTDVIGSQATNELLGMRRAETVRRVLINSGIPAHHILASSAGSREPVSMDCVGTQVQKIACYAPDRRVELHIDVLELKP